MDNIDELLTRGVEKIYPSKEALETVLRTGKKLRIYQGFDPTAPELHLGHMIGLRKLRQWQDLGHEVIFLIGDFTGMIGDPSGKDKTRIPLTREQVLLNAKTYQEQARRVLRFSGENPVQLKFNSTWLGKLSAEELLRLTSNLTYQQVIERDMFQKRLEKKMDISLVEFFYPFMQGYDSVAMDIDVEVGGSDQLFNMMTGRDLMRKLKKKEKFVMTTPLLTDSSGRKIGKTTGNIITLTAPANDFYGLIMSLGDDVIVRCFEYLTDLPLDEVNEIREKIKKGENPMVYKKKLARKLTAMLNSEASAEEAEKEFERVHQKGQIPEQVSIFKLSNKITDFYDLLVKSQIASSRGEAKRLIEQRAIKVNGKTVKNSWDYKISQGTIMENSQPITGGITIQKGPTKFIKIES
ncbi:MAG: tyrosine--tRNA ligase [Patescibacteria group bacterium]|nr:tyrosine--tRNA ligase [Patescibacteria group bacterium]MCL5095419.1 tyrosine--tRNA ligase [Patescibacteria group bacterium]